MVRQNSHHTTEKQNYAQIPHVFQSGDKNHTHTRTHTKSLMHAVKYGTCIIYLQKERELFIKMYI